MRATIRPHPWSLGHRFSIRTEDGAELYRVEGRFGWRHDLTFEDPAGRPVARLRQRYARWRSHYELHRGPEPSGPPEVVITKGWKGLRSQYSVDLPSTAEAPDLTVQVSCSERHHIFERAKVPIARAEKSLWSGAFQVEIDDGEDELLVLATCVAMGLTSQDEMVAVMASSFVVVFLI